MSRERRVTIKQDALDKLVDDSNLLGCLEAAGINNCEAYSIGYQQFLQEQNDGS